MNNEPKLIKLLRTLNKDELTNLDKYIKGMLGKNNDCYILFAYLIKHCGNSKITFDAHYLLLHVLPQSTIKSISNYLSLLKLQCEDWLVLFTIKKDKLKYNNILLEGYLQKELHDLADDQVLKLNESINENTGFSIEKKIALAEMNHQLYFSGHAFKNIHKGEAMNIVMQSYIDAVIHSLLLYQIELKNWGTIHSMNFDKWYKTISQWSKFIPTKDTNFLISLGNIQDKPSAEALHKLDEIFSKGIVDTKSRFYIDALDYLRIAGMRLFRQNQNIDINYTISKYVQRLHHMEKNAMHISSQLLINITSQLSLIYPYEKIKEFIEKWIYLINIKERNVTLLRCHAANCLYHDMYDQLPLYILGKEFKNIDDKITVTILLLISLYMSREKEAAETRLKNFNYFLKRNNKDLGDNKLKRYYNFIKFYSLLLKEDKVSAELCLKDEIAYRMWCSKVIKK